MICETCKCEIDGEVHDRIELYIRVASQGQCQHKRVTVNYCSQACYENRDPVVVM